EIASLNARSAILLAGRRPKIKRGPGTQSDFDKTRFDQSLVQGSRGKSGAVRHKPIAAGKGGRVTEDHIERGYRTARRQICRFLEPIVDDELRNLLQIGKSQQ